MAPIRGRSATGATDRAAERARIIEAAYRLLADSDGSSAPIMDVLAAAGLSTRAFYRHFDSKDALLLAMFRNDSDRVLAELRALADQAPTARDALHGWINAMLGLAADPRRRWRALVLNSDEVTRAKGFRAEKEHYEAEQDSALTDLLRRGLRDGSLPRAEPDTDAPLLRAVLHEGFAKIIERPTGSGAVLVVRGVLSLVDRALGIGPTSQ